MKEVNSTLSIGIMNLVGESNYETNGFNIPYYALSFETRGYGSGRIYTPDYDTNDYISIVGPVMRNNIMYTQGNTSSAIALRESPKDLSWTSASPSGYTAYYYEVPSVKTNYHINTICPFGAPGKYHLVWMYTDYCPASSYFISDVTVYWGTYQSSDKNRLALVSEWNTYIEDGTQGGFYIPQKSSGRAILCSDLSYYEPE